MNIDPKVKALARMAFGRRNVTRSTRFIMTNNYNFAVPRPPDSRYDRAAYAPFKTEVIQLNQFGYMSHKHNLKIWLAHDAITDTVLYMPIRHFTRDIFDAPASYWREIYEKYCDGQ